VKCRGNGCNVKATDADQAHFKSTNNHFSQALYGLITWLNLILTKILTAAQVLDVKLV